MLLPSRLLCILGVCGVVWMVLVMLLVVMVVVVLLWAVLLFGLRFWSEVGFWLGDRSEVGEDLFSEVRGDPCWAGGGTGLLLGCWVCLWGAKGASGSLACGCIFGFGRGLVDEGEGVVGGGSGGW